MVGSRNRQLAQHQEAQMGFAGFFISTGSDHDVLMTIPSSSRGAFDQPVVAEQIDGRWIDMGRLPHQDLVESDSGGRGRVELLARAGADFVGFSWSSSFTVECVGSAIKESK